MDTYKISQIAQLLGISIDTIRFYEKKGFVHPSINKNNNYREYDVNNILELLDIIYYRNFELSLQEISSIMTEGNREYIQELLQKKKKETEEKIRYEQQLLKKITYISDTFQRVENNQNRCSIKEFPSSIVLFKSEETKDFFTKQIAHLSQDQFVLCSLYKTYDIKENDIYHKQIIISMEQDIMDELQMPYKQKDITSLSNQKCIFLVINMTKKNIENDDLKPVFQFAKEHHLTLDNTLYVREIPLTSYQDHKNYYAEIYIPIKEI